MFATYQPGHSLLHRLPAGLKILLVCALILAVSLSVRDAWHVLPALGFAAALYAIGRIRPRAAWDQVRPVLPMLLAILVLQWIVADLDTALRVSGALLVAVAVAGLVALTTRVSDMLDAVTRAAQPLRRVGVSPDRVALVLVLTIRAIPLLARQLRQVTEARKARGLGMSIRALVVPTVLGALTTADQLGDALAARGVDD
ncbi:MAG: energy-coupling factor transporter transmembrane protein EcfT [Dietzia sp.]|uniref:Energy-coupling factor transporter transmembrane protein EcfT n=1 Tax=Dietzia cercidiphylli TaxID=498199 RepID=A0ABP4URG2_9ACTN|nr:energy-coupling factor transporter transmembrane protein EcfT [Dietzia sp.]MBB1037145.1 energy-coupling factor transporter transmembrane protein EcfT [Dietzia natronolimnaea]MBB1041471.1 energy-coupling factor transporter transmembrane protein EcfT [Dietzia sp. Cai40]MBB1047661.1 energy-coupling factor transporter transmembrane protein EcfT [Dietzia cercidiphylli]MBB1052080.1 energy-coupling factor transporter transmembrane protein EcfT [Dietzia sp. CW19]MBB1052853.1 energy-coupling factor 